MRLLAPLLLAGCASLPNSSYVPPTEAQMRYIQIQVLILQAERDTAVKIAVHERALRQDMNCYGSPL